MKTLKKLLFVVAMGAVTASAFAVEQAQVEQSIELKDGSTVYFFKDGKMGMEDKLGKTASMAPGHVMETKDGKKIIMIGDEIYRVERLLREKNRGRK